MTLNIVIAEFVGEDQILLIDIRSGNKNDISLFIEFIISNDSL